MEDYDLDYLSVVGYGLYKIKHVVKLEKRINFLEHQLKQKARYSEFKNMMVFYRNKFRHLKRLMNGLIKDTPYQSNAILEELRAYDDVKHLMDESKDVWDSGDDNDYYDEVMK